MSYRSSLRKEIKEMWALVHSQHKKSLTALVNFDKDLAREIILIEERVDSSEQLIDSDCESYFSLQTLKSVNIQFVMLILKMNRNLERIGDLAEGVAKDLLSMRNPYSSALVKEMRLVEMYQMTLKMLELLCDAFDKEDSSMARIALNRTEVFEDMSLDTNNKLISYLNDHPGETDNVLHIFSIIKILDGVVDQSKSLAQEIILCNESLMMSNVNS